MGKKRKGNKRSSQPQPTHIVNNDVSEELAVLQAIYDSYFELLDDGMGCKLHVVPYPGNMGRNEAHVDLEVRWDSRVSNHIPLPLPWHMAVHCALSESEMLHQKG
jgi:hypothetical protein